MVVYRTAQWHPDLVTHLFVVCTPYAPPSQKFVSTEDIVTGSIPGFGYQLQLAGPEVEEAVQTPAQIKQFLKGLYGGRTEGGQVLFRGETGVDLSVLDTIGDTPLIDNEVSHNRRLSQDKDLLKIRSLTTMSSSIRTTACTVHVSVRVHCCCAV